MSDTLYPGDLVCLDIGAYGERIHSAISSQPGFIDNTNLDLGDLESNDIAMVIYHDIVEEETLIITSTGLLGWIVTDTLKWVSDRRQNE